MLIPNIAYAAKQAICPEILFLSFIVNPFDHTNVIILEISLKGIEIDFTPRQCVLLIISVMKRVVLVVSVAVMMAALAGCNSQDAQQRKAMDEPMKQEREFMDQAIRHRSPDVMRVDVIDSTVVFTHIYDGIVDVKAYTFDGDVCVAAERVYTFPTQMSALRHYRDAIEKAELYDKIEMFNNQVRYKLKDSQHETETKGLTKDQLKAKFDKQIADAKADMARAKDHHKDRKSK